eukprot:GEMP01056393.1.p1 GENE.GEMP01056393.1~~GEMP01056393.1.p1  ORF type:complete len:311 (+),score=86.00 GEMP01056393.1:87-1019(+)
MGRFSPEDCPLKLLCPFSIRFSQAKMDSSFQSGYFVDDMVEHIDVQEGEDGVCILDAPFPPVVVILWRPRLKDGGGKQLHDGVTGERVRGRPAWFTVDNRRLYCLQRKATALWPLRVRCPVHVLDLTWSSGRIDDPRILNLRKFSTPDAGRSISVCHGSRMKPTHWSWMQSIDRSHAQTISSLSFVQDDAIKDDSMVVDLTALPEIPLALRFTITATRTIEYPLAGLRAPPAARASLDTLLHHTHATHAAAPSHVSLHGSSSSENDHLSTGARESCATAASHWGAEQPRGVHVDVRALFSMAQRAQNCQW